MILPAAPGVMKERYASLDLLIEPLGEGFRARLLDDSGPVTVDFDLESLGALLADPIPEGSGAAPARDVQPVAGVEVRRDLQSLRAAGSALFAALFRDKLETAYRLGLRSAQDRGEGLRIRLRLGEAPRLEELPWESLYDPEAAQFLGLSPALSLVRYWESQARPRPLRVAPPLHVLGVLASPAGEARLAVEEEWNSISQELAEPQQQGLVRLTRLEPGTVEGLLDHLKNHPCHVLHFICHGTFDAGAGCGRVLLESPDGAPEPVDDHRLATAMQRHGEVRLAVINACHSARVAPAEAGSGVARSLMRAGVPAVVAMRSAVGDRHAVFFATHFYRHLVSGLPIEGAVAAARSDLYLHHGGTSWSLPVLALRSTDPELLGLESPGEGQMRPLLGDGDAGGHRRWRWPLLALAALVLALGLLWGAAELWPQSADDGVGKQVVEVGPNPPQCPSPKGLAISMQYIEPDRLYFEPSEEVPGRDLRLEKGFCIGRFEVTQFQWESVLPEVRHESDYLGSLRPVARVKRSEVKLFLDRINDREVDGTPFRLPKGLEWEFAARGGATTKYYHGDDAVKLSSYANCLSIDGRDVDGIVEVGSYAANEFGLYDVLGNVWEWIEDTELDEEGRIRGLLRGGGFSTRGEQCVLGEDRDADPERRDEEHGFRIARDAVAL